MSNIIQIKRRLVGSPQGTTIPVLSSGELAYNEINNVLYYGRGANNSLAIAGSGAFVSTSANQTIGGSKTFSNSVTFESGASFSGTTTFNGITDHNNNRITEVGTPTQSTDAATKGYVDTGISNNSSALASVSSILASSINTLDTLVDNNYTNTQTATGSLTTRINTTDSNVSTLETKVNNNYTNTQAATGTLASSINTTNSNVSTLESKVNTNYTNTQTTTAALDTSITAVNSRVTSLSSAAAAQFFAKAGGTVSGNVTITGDLAVLGNTTTIDTTITTTSAFSVTNNGTGPALTVTQNGSQNIATFYDDGVVAFTIEDGGNVGIGVADPTAKLDVGGAVKVAGKITNVTNPTEAQDAATKAYVDTAIAILDAGEF